MTDDGSSPRITSLGLGFAVAAISTSALFVRFAEPIDHSLIAAGRVSISAVGLALLAPGSLRLAAMRCVRDPKLGARVTLAGALLGLHFGAWIASLTMTSVLRSVALVSTQPLFAGLLGRIVGDRAPWPLFVGAAVAIVGTVVLVGGVSGLELGDGESLGDALALLGAVTAAAYLTVGRSVKEELPLAGYFVLVNLVAALCLWTWVSVRGPWSSLTDATSGDLLAVFYVGVVPGVVGHGLLNWAVRRAPVHVVSLAILLEPLGASALAWVFLAEAVGPVEAVGALVVLVGVAVGLWPLRDSQTGADPPSPTSSPTA